VVARAPAGRQRLRAEPTRRAPAAIGADGRPRGAAAEGDAGARQVERFQHSARRPARSRRPRRRARRSSGPAPQVDDMAGCGPGRLDHDVGATHVGMAGADRRAQLRRQSASRAACGESPSGPRLDGTMCQDVKVPSQRRAIRTEEPDRVTVGAQCSSRHRRIDSGREAGGGGQRHRMFGRLHRAGRTRADRSLIAGRTGRTVRS